MRADRFTPGVKAAASGGFTFVEALTVGVIMAILAAVAIPIYSGYIENQCKTVVGNLAKTAAVSANVYYRRHNLAPNESDLNLYLSDPARYSVDVTATHVIVTDSDCGDEDVKDSASFQ